MGQILRRTIITNPLIGAVVGFATGASFFGTIGVDSDMGAVLGMTLGVVTGGVLGLPLPWLLKAASEAEYIGFLAGFGLIYGIFTGVYVGSLPYEIAAPPVPWFASLLGTLSGAIVLRIRCMR